MSANRSALEQIRAQLAQQAAEIDRMLGVATGASEATQTGGFDIDRIKLGMSKEDLAEASQAILKALQGRI